MRSLLLLAIIMCVCFKYSASVTMFRCTKLDRRKDCDCFGVVGLAMMLAQMAMIVVMMNRLISSCVVVCLCVVCLILHVRECWSGNPGDLQLLQNNFQTLNDKL